MSVLKKKMIDKHIFGMYFNNKYFEFLVHYIYFHIKSNRT